MPTFPPCHGALTPLKARRAQRRGRAGVPHLRAVRRLIHSQRYERIVLFPTKNVKKRMTRLPSFSYHPPLCLPYASLTSPFGKRKQYGNDTEAIWKQKRRQRKRSGETGDGTARQTLTSKKSTVLQVPTLRFGISHPPICYSCLCGFRGVTPRVRQIVIRFYAPEKPCLALLKRGVTGAKTHNPEKPNAKTL